MMIKINEPDKLIGKYKKLRVEHDEPLSKIDIDLIGYNDFNKFTILTLALCRLLEDSFLCVLTIEYFNTLLKIRDRSFDK